MQTLTELERLTRQVQALLGVAADGYPGPVTMRAVLAAIQAANAEGAIPPFPDFDERTEKNLATLTPAAQAAFRPFIHAAKAEAAAYGLRYIAIQGNRTAAEQNALYAQGRTKPGPIVTNAKAGQSNHNFGRALDFGVFDQAGRYLDAEAPALAEKIHRAAGRLAPEYGLAWGGTWKSITDLPHFELPA